MVGRRVTFSPDNVVYMSGYTSDTIARYGVLEAGTAFISKPFAPDVLLRKVRKALDVRP